MKKQIELKIIIICLSVITSISVFFNIYYIATRTKQFEQENDVYQISNNNEIITDDKVDNEKEQENDIEIKSKEEQEPKKEYIYKYYEDQEPKKEYIYKYIEGKEVEKEKEVMVEKTIEVPSVSTDATVKYIDVDGNTKTINLPSGTTIKFSAGEHGIYDSIPSPITLTDNQELDISGTSYSPSKVEVNYIFKGFSYSGDTMTCAYSLANNIVNVESRQIANLIIKNGIPYIKHEYLESTGTQYINTNITLPSDCVLEIDIQFTASNITNLIGTVGANLGRADFGILNNKWFCYMGDDFYGNDRNGDIDRHLFKMDYDNKTFSIDGTVLKTFSEVKGTQMPYILFARYDVSSISPYAKCKLYEWKITRNNVAIYDLIPAERTSDKKLGMLDLVSGTFLVNEGSDEFKHPDVILLPGINAGKVMASGSYEIDSVLSLTARANDGYRFVGWSDGNTEIERTITIGDEIVYTALFAPSN